MWHSIKNGEDLDNLKVLVSLQNQVKELRLQDKLGEQNFHENIKKYLNRLLIQKKVPVKD